MSAKRAAGSTCLHPYEAGRVSAAECQHPGHRWVVSGEWNASQHDERPPVLGFGLTFAPPAPHGPGPRSRQKASRAARACRPSTPRRSVGVQPVRQQVCRWRRVRDPVPVLRMTRRAPVRCRAWPRTLGLARGIAGGDRCHDNAVICAARGAIKARGSDAGGAEYADPEGVTGIPYRTPAAPVVARRETRRRGPLGPGLGHGRPTAGSRRQRTRAPVCASERLLRCGPTAGTVHHRPGVRTACRALVHHHPPQHHHPGLPELQRDRRRRSRPVSRACCQAAAGAGAAPGESRSAPSQTAQASTTSPPRRSRELIAGPGETSSTGARSGPT